MAIDSFSGEYRFLSNFWISPITVEIDGETISGASVEHVYQALKTTNRGQRIAILSSRKPGGAKSLGKSLLLRPDWEEVKLGFMETLVRAKFTQNPALGAALLDTLEEELVEGNWWGDRFWGVCRGQGENHLGKILMKVRSEIREKQQAALAEMVRHDEEMGLYEDESVVGAVADECEGVLSAEAQVPATEVTTPPASSDSTAPQFTGPFARLDRWVHDTQFFSAPWQWMKDPGYRESCLIPGVTEEVIRRLDSGDYAWQYFTLLCRMTNYDPILPEERGLVAKMAARWVKWYRNRDKPEYWSELEQEVGGAPEQEKAEESGQREGSTESTQ